MRPPLFHFFGTGSGKGFTYNGSSGQNVVKAFVENIADFCKHSKARFANALFPSTYSALVNPQKLSERTLRHLSALA